MKRETKRNKMKRNLYTEGFPKWANRFEQMSHTPNSPFAPPTVIRGKYIAVMRMYSVIILILHGSYTKSLEL
jgi:hypothetical protein